MKKLFQYKNTLLIILFLCILPIPILYHWFSNGTIIYFWDINFPLDPILGLNHFFYLWKANIFPGFFDTGWSWLPYVILLVVFNFFWHSMAMTQALLYWVLLISSLITFSILLRYLFRLYALEEGVFMIFVEIIGSVLYAFNTYIYYYSFRIFNPQEFIIAFLPLNFLALLHLYPIEKFKEKKSNKFFLRWLIVYFISLFFMTPGFSTLIYYIEYIGIIGFYLLFQISFRRLWSIKGVIVRSYFLLLIFVFNLWWFFPMYLGLHDVYTKAAQIGTTIYFTLSSQLSNLLNSSRIIGLPPMQTPIFSWENLYIYNQIFTFPLFIFFLFLLLLAFKLPKIKAKGTTLFLFSIFCIMFFIVKEANPPFSFILQFAFNHVPFFGVFRDSYQKAGLFYIFVYFVLFSLALGVVYKDIHWKKKYLGVGIIILSLLATAIITAPFFIFPNIPSLKSEKNGQTLTFSAKTKIPQEYLDLKSFLEPICQNTTAIVIPRTSILSSAYWPSKGYSYVGQDILSNLIGCNFISTQVLDSNIDSYYSVPYLSLQKENISGFKNILAYSGIKFVIIRNDYKSNNLTDYISVDSNKITSLLSKDSDFIRVYRNSIFTVYTYKSTNENKYGIAIPQISSFTNADFSSARSTQILFDLLPQGNVFVSDTYLPENKEQPIVFANCIGCEYLPGSGPAATTVPSDSQTNSLIQHIKEIFHPHEAVKTLDDDLNNMDTAFNTWMYTHDLKDERAYIKAVKITMKEYRRMLTGDFFTDDYTKIKVRNYLMNEYTGLSQNKSDNQNNVNIYHLQQSMLNQVKSNLWETNFASHEFRYRMDIPKTAHYICSVNNNNNLISVSSITIDNHIINDLPFKLTNDSHKVEVSYKSKDIFSQTPFNISGKYKIIKKIRLSGFIPGSYYAISMHTANAQATGIHVFISNENIPLQNIESKSNEKNNSFIYSSTESSESFAQGLTNYFFSTNNIDEIYYLYIVADLRNTQSELSFSQFSITPIPTKDTLIVSCKSIESIALPLTSFSVKKRNPTAYTVTIGSVQSLKNRYLTFNQSYHIGWVAYTFLDGKKHIYSHTKNAGYANAWYIDTVGEDGKIYIEFLPQRKSEVVGIVSIGAFILLIIGFVIFHRKKIV